MVKIYSSGVKKPLAYSFTEWIYYVLDVSYTDFDTYKYYVPVIDLLGVENRWAYHTEYDVIENVHKGAQ